MWNFLIPIAHAQDPVVIPGAPSLIPDCARQIGGADSLACGVELFSNISQILLGVVGALMLALFVYGGILFLFSQGGPQVQKATNILKGALIGLVIVFGSFSAVTWAVNGLRGSDGGTSDATNYVACYTQAVQRDGTIEIASINDGEACAPGFICQAGECVDQLYDDQDNAQ